MARPFRPNPSDATKRTDAYRRAHVRQESRHERKARLRAEAEARNALTPVERTRKYRLAHQESVVSAA